MSGTYYRQCFLRKVLSYGTCDQVLWLPDKFAVAGKLLRLRDDAGAWDDGWRVLSVGDNRRDDAHVPDVHEDIKGHLRNTGDAETVRRKL